MGIWLNCIRLQAIFAFRRKKKEREITANLGCLVKTGPELPQLMCFPCNQQNPGSQTWSLSQIFFHNWKQSFRHRFATRFSWRVTLGHLCLLLLQCAALMVSTLSSGHVQDFRLDKQWYEQVGVWLVILMWSSETFCRHASDRISPAGTESEDGDPAIQQLGSSVCLLYPIRWLHITHQLASLVVVHVPKAIRNRYP